MQTLRAVPLTQPQMQCARACAGSMVAAATKISVHARSDSITFSPFIEAATRGGNDANDSVYVHICHNLGRRHSAPGFFVRDGSTRRLISASIFSGEEGDPNPQNWLFAKFGGLGWWGDAGR